MLETELAIRRGDFPNAASYILELARAKFRKGYPQGQFGELLLFNFLEHFFEAPPLLRKMPITTNSSVERHGADAIHIGIVSDSPIIYIGEAKTYKSTYKFNKALEEAVESVVKAHDRLQDELDLYVFDDFIELPFKKIAEQVKRNQIPYKVELVSIIAYTETNSCEASCESDIKQRIQAILQDRIKSIVPTLFSKLNPHLVARMHFFLLPFWGLDRLLQGFDQ
jgi:hypothetical protein